MKKRILAFLLMLVMLVSVLPVNALAARHDQPGGGGGNTPSESHYDEKDKFGYDSMSSNGTLTGITVSVGTTKLTEGNATSTTGAAISSGVTITFESGYYLKSFKIVCGDKYSCRTDASGNAISKSNVMSGATASSITLDADDGITKTAFGHTSDEDPYWILLEIGYDDTEYEVSYNWGALVGNIQTTAPATQKHKVNDVVTVASPAQTALDEAYALGYRFTGWKDTADNVAYNPGNQFGMPQKNVTLEAQWEKIPEKDVTVTKIWKDADDQDGIRPESIQVQLKNGETNVGDPVTLTDSNLTHTWTGLAADGDYKVVEVSVPTGYTSATTGNATDGYTITNTHTPEVTSYTVTKKWADDSDRDGIRPDSVSVQLKANGAACGEPVTVSGTGDSWTYTWSNLPKKSGGVDIVYSAEEVSVPTGYSASVVGSTITNTQTNFEKTSVTVTKVWDDADNQDGIRPSSVTIQLLANGTAYGDAVSITGTGNTWTYTWNDLYVNEGGKAITYTVKEVEISSDYTSSVDGLTITNTHTPAKTTYTVTKVWDDASNQDGIRPSSVTIQLLANGTAYGDAVSITGSGNTWTYTWNDLPKYSAGNEITYSVAELSKVEGYTATISGNTVTNTHKIDTTSVSGSKTWKDDNDAKGARPDSITIKLLANGVEYASKTVTAADEWKWEFTDLPVNKEGAVGQKITYTIEEGAVANYTASVNGYNVTNTYTPGAVEITVTKTWDDADNQDGIRPAEVTVQLKANGTAYGEAVKLNEDNKWTYVYENVNAFDENGKGITFSVEEVKVDGYTTDVTEAADGYSFTITNTHTPATTMISGSKTWADNDDQDGVRPESITINLLADDVEIYDRVVNAESGWAWTFENLPAYNGGKEIKYTITEDAVKGYEAEVDGYNVTNSYTPKTKEITVTKVWDDKDNQDGKRPESVTVILYADGVEVDTTVITAGEEGNWTYTFTDLPVCKAGEEIVYTVAEVLPENTTYVPTIDNEAFTITNKDDPDKTSVTVRKAWVDADNQDGVRPDSVTLALMANKEKVQDVVLTAKEGWTATISDLDKYYDSGKLIDYTFVEEGEIAEYKYVSTAVDPDTGIITVTNAHETYTIDLTVNKEWDDGDNQDGIRPDSVKVSLYADGELVETVELSKTNKWTYKWTDMDLMANGKKIVYTVKEEVPTGYTTAEYVELKDGAATIVNTHEPEVWETQITKVWYDNKDASGHRPDSVTVQLYKNGKKYGDKIKLTEKDGWKYAVELPVYEDGKKIEWTVKETNVPKYYDDSYKQETLTVKNTIQTDGSAKTGDMSHIFLWVSLMGISAVAIVAFLAMSKKRNRR